MMKAFQKLLSAALAVTLLCTLVTVSPARGETSDYANIALGKSVTATSSYSAGFFETNLINDGIWTTYNGADLTTLGWCSNPYDPIEKDTEIIIEMDLGGTYDIDKMIIKPMMWANGMQTPCAYDLDLYTKTGWVTVASDEGIDAYQDEDTDMIPLEYKFAKTAASRARIVITENSDTTDRGTGNYLSSIGEWEIWGVPSGADAQLPTSVPTEAPTQAPTAEPTAAPTESPYSAGLKNIALNQQIEASSSYIAPEGFFNVNLLNDGHWDTYANGNVKLGWNSDTTPPQDEECDVEILLTLDACYDVSVIVLKPMQWSRGESFPKDYELQCSLDGSSWTTLVAEEDKDVIADSDTEVEPVVYNIDTTPMKYFRILISRHGMVGSNGAYYSAIGELELYGELSKGETMTMDINKPALILNPGETDWLKILGNPGKVEFAATYSSSDENVVKVDADGTVTAVANGTAVITATANESGKSYTCAVTVEEFKPSSKFQIVAFIPYFYGSEVTETTFDNLKNGGITNVELNFALDDSALTEESVRKALELAYARGLDVTVSSKQFSNVTWPNKSETQVLDFVKQWSHLPGVAAFYITDEPASSIPYARAISLVKSVMPYAVTHMNYCGAYEANVTELQKELTKKYGISLDYVMYDAYTFRSAVCDEALLYSQLIYNHNISKKLGIPGACYIQSMAWNNNHRPNGDEIRYQVFASLACGIKQISYFCWKTPRANSAETYGPAVIDIDNNPTDLFEPVSEINAQVQALGPTLMKLEFFDIYHTGKSFGSGYNQLPGGFFLQPVNYEDKLAISHLEDADGQVYSMVVNRDYKNGLELKFTLSDAVSSICRISDETGEPVKLTPDSSGVYTVSLKPGEGVLLQADASYKYDLKETANFYYINKTISDAEKLDLAAYKDTGKDAFTKALEDAKAVAANENASQSEVDTAKARLLAAINNLKPFAAEGVNLALHKSVDAPNSYQDGTYWAKEFLTDGINVPLDENTNAGWSVDPGSGIGRDDEVAVTVDLEEKYLINTVILKPCIYNSGATMPSDFTVQISSDGSEWTDVASVEGLTLTEALDQTYTFDYIEGRYVRIRITRNSETNDANGTALSQLGEFEVYGREVANGVPDPTAAPEETAQAEATSEPADSDSTAKKANPLPWIIGGAAVLAAGIAAAMIIKKKKVN